MKRAEKGKKIAGILEKLYPETPIPLDHNSAYTTSSGYVICPNYR